MATKRKQPPVYAPGEAPSDDAVYVRLPLPPAVLGALQEHAANASRLVELVTGTNAAVADVVAHITKTGLALQRDVTKMRATLKGRRRR